MALTSAPSPSLTALAAFACCEICSNYFATDYNHNDSPDERRRTRAPLQSQSCSHVMCFPCAEEMIATNASGRPIRVYVDCPWCRATKAFSLRGQVSLVTCAVSSWVQSSSFAAVSSGSSSSSSSSSARDQLVVPEPENHQWTDSDEDFKYMFLEEELFK